MENNTDLRIAGIFITMIASAIGFGIPYLRGAPKSHEEAISSSWMSLKSFSAGVMLSVAFVHLLGESLHTLSEAAASHSEEEGEEEEEHSFPIGMVLCVVGIVLALGLETAGGMLLHRKESLPKSCTDEYDEIELHKLSSDGNNNTEKYTYGSYGHTPSRRQDVHICDDPYRLEHGHNHSHALHEESLVHCHGEHASCGDGSRSDAKIGLDDSGNKIHPNTLPCHVDINHHGHEHAGHADASQNDIDFARPAAVIPSVSKSTDNLTSTQNIDCCTGNTVPFQTLAVDIMRAAGPEIHRHVTITVENTAKSILKSLLLEAAVTVHSVIIGVTLGGIEDSRVLGVLLAAYAFHQLAEGIALGSASLQAEYSPRYAIAFMLVFALSVPAGILIGLNVPTTDHGKEIQASFGCVAAGSLIYTSLVEMVAEDFSHIAHGKHGTSVKGTSRPDWFRFAYMYISFIAGISAMSVLAKWA